MMDEVATSPFAGSLDAVTTLFAELGEELRSTEGKSAFAAVTRTAVRRVEGAAAASITTLRSGRFQTVGATDERAARADAIQYELGSGPCLDALLEDNLYWRTTSTDRTTCAPTSAGRSTARGWPSRSGS